MPKKFTIVFKKIQNMVKKFFKNLIELTASLLSEFVCDVIIIDTVIAQAIPSCDRTQDGD